MEWIKPGINIEFIKNRNKFFALSGVVILISLLGVFVYPRPNWGIDFAGGFEMEISFTEAVNIDKVRDAIESIGLHDVKVQEVVTVGSNLTTYLLRTQGAEYGLDQGKTETEDQKEAEIKQKTADLITGKLTEVFGDGKYNVEATNYVGPKVGAELRRDGILAVVYALALILIYITLRFEFRHGMGAVIALVHDVFITLGALVWMHKEFSLTTIAAVLTIVGYSLNDTIVVFDRIRENSRRLKRLPFDQMVNQSINETLSRTVLTALTTLFTLAAIFFLGGNVIHDFAYAMMVGITTGTYSSIFVASALIVVWEHRRALQRTPAAADNKKEA